MSLTPPGTRHLSAMLFLSLIGCSPDQAPLPDVTMDSIPALRTPDSLRRGAEGQPHETITEAGHFLQEDKGEELAERLASFVETS